MHCQRHTLHLLLAFLVAVSLSACDLSEQNFDYQPGSSLTISGAAEVTAPDTTDYFVQAYTINKDYTWTVSGAAEILRERRDGEYIDVVFPEAGTYTIEVDDGEYTGSLEVTAVPPE